MVDNNAENFVEGPLNRGHFNIWQHRVGVNYLGVALFANEGVWFHCSVISLWYLKSNVCGIKCSIECTSALVNV